MALLLAAFVVTGLAGWKYRRDRALDQNIYTETVKQRDISDAAQKAISALQDAALNGQSYALTGETFYSEAYAADLRTFEDELGTLQVIAEHDAATPLVREFSETAVKIQSELAATIALVDKGSLDAKLDVIRKKSGIARLQRAREIVAQIQQDGLRADESDQRLIRIVLREQTQMTGACIVLFCLVLGTTLLAWETRAKRDMAKTSHVDSQVLR